MNTTKVMLKFEGGQGCFLSLAVALDTKHNFKNKNNKKVLPSQFCWLRKFFLGLKQQFLRVAGVMHFSYIVNLKQADQHSVT